MLREMNARPFQEVVARFEKLQLQGKNVSLILTCTPQKARLSFPRNSREAIILQKAVEGLQKGEKIGIMFTDNPQKPLAIRSFNRSLGSQGDGGREGRAQ